MLHTQDRQENARHVRSYLFAMPTPSTAKWPKPRSEDEFEDIVVDFLRIRWKDPNAQRHGRRGQRQYGVDVLGHPPRLKGRTAGGQCKNTDALYLADVIAEVDKAKTFPGGLAEFYVVTTEDRDVDLQAEVREHFRANPPPFHIELIFWPDVVADISLDEKLVAKHWKGFGAAPAGPIESRPPDWIDRDGARDNEKAEYHCELLVRPSALTGLDATELLAELEKGTGTGPSDFIAEDLLQKPRITQGTRFIWKASSRPYDNVFEKWEMEIADAGQVIRRWSKFTTHDHVDFDTVDALHNIVVPLWKYARAIDAWSPSLTDVKRAPRVALRLSAHATKPMRLHDTLRIVESPSRFSSPVGPEDWQIELEDDLSAGATRVALRLLNRAVARFVAEPDRWGGQDQRKLVRINERAYMECLARLGL